MLNSVNTDPKYCIYRTYLCLYFDEVSLLYSNIKSYIDSSHS